MKVWSLMWGNFISNVVSSGMSAQSLLFNLYYALYAVCLMNYLVVWWTTYSFDVDPRKQDKQLGFKQSDLYTYCRMDIFWYY